MSMNAMRGCTRRSSRCVGFAPRLLLDEKGPKGAGSLLDRKCTSGRSAEVTCVRLLRIQHETATRVPRSHRAANRGFLLPSAARLWLALHSQKRRHIMQIICR